MISKGGGVVFEQLLQQVAEARERAQQAAQAAQDDRRRRREENDLWVTGGVNWNGYGLEPLVKMVAENASPGQLNALAGEWSKHGMAVSKASGDLQIALGKLMQYWTGAASDQAARSVMTNARWIGELGQTAQQMSGPIMDASGALRSAQDTMPGVPKNNWVATAGGGAAAGFAVAGPIGAAFGAAIGGIASAFGFGNKKKKMKRKAVQTMERFEGAVLGIDQVTPQFGSPSDGVDPGTPSGPRPDPGIPGAPGIPSPPPGGGVVRPSPPPGGGVVRPSPPPIDGSHVTDPSFSNGPDGRWQSLTGLGPGGSGFDLRGGGGMGGASSNVGLGTGAFGGMPGMGRGAGGMGGTAGRGGAGAGGRGAGGRGAGRGGGFPGSGMGGAGGRGDREYKGRGRFSKSGAFGSGGAPHGRQDEEEDSEHRRSVPIEEDLFSSDLKAAPPVIGL